MSLSVCPSSTSWDKKNNSHISCSLKVIRSCVIVYYGKHFNILWFYFSSVMLYLGNWSCWQSATDERLNFKNKQFTITFVEIILIDLQLLENYAPMKETIINISEAKCHLILNTSSEDYIFIVIRCETHWIFRNPLAHNLLASLVSFSVYTF